MQPTTRRALCICLVSLLLTATTGAPLRADSPRGEEVDRLRLLEASESDFEVALSAHRRGDLGAAIHAYGLAIEKDPEFIEAIVNLGRALSDQGLQPEAEEWLDRALRLRRDYYALHKVRGLVALRRGDSLRGVEAYTRALALRPHDTEILINLGAAFLELGRPVQAIDVLNRAATLAPDNPEAALDLAVSHDLAAETGPATYYYERFLKIASRKNPLRHAVQSRLDELAGETTNAVSARPPASAADESQTQSQTHQRRTP